MATKDWPTINGLKSRDRKLIKRATIASNLPSLERRTGVRMLARHPLYSKSWSNARRGRSSALALSSQSRQMAEKMSSSRRLGKRLSSLIVQMRIKSTSCSPRSIRLSQSGVRSRLTSKSRMPQAHPRKNNLNPASHKMKKWRGRMMRTKAKARSWNRLTTNLSELFSPQPAVTRSLQTENNKTEGVEI